MPDGSISSRRASRFPKSRSMAMKRFGTTAAMVQQHSGNAAGPQPEVQEAEADADNGGRVTPVYGGSSNAAVDDANRSGSANGDSEALPRRLQSWAWQKGELQGRSAAHRAALS